LPRQIEGDGSLTWQEVVCKWLPQEDVGAAVRVGKFKDTYNLHREYETENLAERKRSGRDELTGLKNACWRGRFREGPAPPPRPGTPPLAAPRPARGCCGRPSGSCPPTRSTTRRAARASPRRRGRPGPSPGRRGTGRTSPRTTP